MNSDEARRNMLGPMTVDRVEAKNYCPFDSYSREEKNSGARHIDKSMNAILAAAGQLMHNALVLNA